MEAKVCNNMDSETILKKLPYSEPFLFVDSIAKIDENGVEGSFSFKPDSFFYKGHFKDYPITPGVILTECCAQIGVVCLGIYLEKNLEGISTNIAFSSSEMEFYVPIYPNETVKVVSEKIYYRFHKLKCKVSLYNEEGQLACKGILAGMIKPVTDG